MLELTVFMGAFVQELFSPLPSFVIFIPAGVSLASEGRAVWYVVLLAFVIGISRVLAGMLLYWLSSKLRTWIYTKRHSWLGVKRSDIEKAKKRIGQRGSWWSIFALWAIPIVPGAVISLGAGFLQVPRATFVSATYFGSIINALTYLLLGYFGFALVR